MAITDPSIAIADSNDSTTVVANASEYPCKGDDIVSIDSMKSNIIKFGSFVAEIKEEANFIAEAKTIIGTNVCKNEPPKHMLKLRTAFFEEWEDDEPMANQIITATNSENKCDFPYISEGDVLDNSNIQFGSFSSIVKHDKKYKVLSARDVMSCNIFIGADLCNKESIKEEKQSIQIGSMLVMTKETKDHIHVAKTFPRACNTFISSLTRPQVYPITKLQDMEGPSPFGLGLMLPDRHGIKIP